jgi:hypothetical protein
MNLDILEEQGAPKFGQGSLRDWQPIAKNMMVDRIHQRSIMLLPGQSTKLTV